MPRTDKIERVSELKEQIEGSDALLLAEYRGLTVTEITELRRSLRDGGTRFAVVKNTLMQRAATDAGVAIDALLSGPSAVAFVSGDVVAAAKAIRAASRQYPSLVLKGGYLDGQVLDATQATALADLASRDEMLSQIAGLLKSDMAKVARLFQAAQSKFVSLLEAYKEKLPAEEGASPAIDAGLGSPGDDRGSAHDAVTETADADDTGGDVMAERSDEPTPAGSSDTPEDPVASDGTNSEEE